MEKFNLQKCNSSKIIIGAAIGAACALGIAGYFIYKHIKKNNEVSFYDSLDSFYDPEMEIDCKKSDAENEEETKEDVEEEEA